MKMFFINSINSKPFIHFFNPMESIEKQMLQFPPFDFVPFSDILDTHWPYLSLAW